jgi:hypothetical protein
MKDAKWWREYRAKNREKLREYERNRKRSSRNKKVVEPQPIEPTNATQEG